MVELVLVTSKFHQYRSYYTFIRQLHQHYPDLWTSIRVTIEPVDTEGQHAATQSEWVRELLALALYTMQGKS